MQTNLQVLDRLPPQNQMFFRGFGGQNAEEIIRAASGEVDVQLVARDGNLLVSIDGKQVKTIKLNPEGAGSKGLAFNANVTMTGRVIMNGKVQQSNGDGVEISKFEIDNMSGASIRQFIEEEARLATLTVPRFRRDNPPTHVLIAANGDLLRGQLKSIREADVQFESRLETLRIDRSRVAAIVWLDPPKKDSGKKVEKAAADNATSDQANAAAPGGEAKVAPAVSEATVEEDSENGFVMGDEEESGMQALLADGFSITMTPARLENGQIKGHSKLLGDCAFPAATIKELFLGDPESRTNIAAFDQWIARNAQEPDWDIAAESGGTSEGAAMIGQVADDFELSLLDGSKFRLSDHADKIIVLDFWATWCGPCVAALPDYIAATSEFDSSKVIFVAVNQQEASDQIRGFLTERNLSPIVALDRSGAIGQQFKVSGIPHTVILGKGNVIEDVHVGYQQGGGESMQIAIQQLLDGTWKRPTPEAAPAKPAATPKDPI
jgi:thiol-disulfide isomerase/thioredoxin